MSKEQNLCSRDSMVFYRSFYESIKELSPQNQLEVYNAIFELSLNFREIELSGISKIIFRLIKPQMYQSLKYIDRKSKAYKNWRKEVLKAYNFKCKKCNAVKNLHCHHIKPFAEYVESRFDINNGIVLCDVCHRKEHQK